MTDNKKRPRPRKKQTTMASNEAPGQEADEMIKQTVKEFITGRNVSLSRPRTLFPCPIPCPTPALTSSVDTLQPNLRLDQQDVAPASLQRLPSGKSSGATWGLTPLPLAALRAIAATESHLGIRWRALGYNRQATRAGSKV